MVSEAGGPGSIPDWGISFFTFFLFFLFSFAFSISFHFVFLLFVLKNQVFHFHLQKTQNILIRKCIELFYKNDFHGQNVSFEVYLVIFSCFQISDRLAKWSKASV